MGAHGPLVVVVHPVHVLNTTDKVGGNFLLTFLVHVIGAKETPTKWLYVTCCGFVQTGLLIVFGLGLFVFL